MTDAEFHVPKMARTTSRAEGAQAPPADARLFSRKPGPIAGRAHPFDFTPIRAGKIISTTILDARSERESRQRGRLLVVQFHVGIVSPDGRFQLARIDVPTSCPFDEISGSIRGVGTPPIEYAGVD